MTASRGRKGPTTSEPEVSRGHVALGRILAPRGTQGHLKVYPLTPLRDRFAAGRGIYLAGQRHIIEHARWLGDTLELKLSGIDDRGAAQSLSQHYLEVPEADLQPLDQGQYYHFQLIGLSVRTTQGVPVGRITRILSTGSNDVYVVEGPQGELLLPAIEDVVNEIDLKQQLMTVELVPGLIPR